MKKDRFTELCMDCYRELYRNATPSANFDELLEKAEVDNDGRKVIDYNSYYLDDEVYHQIVNKYKSKIKSKYEKQVFNFQMYLGCGPRTSKKVCTVVQ